MTQNPKSIDRRIRYIGLAEDIIEEARVQLMLKFRFLDRALWRMNLQKVSYGIDYPLATDGRVVYFDAEREVSRFRQSFEETVRDYLHLIMHCIFRHPYDRAHKSIEAWSLTCDIIVENVVMDLASTRFPSENDSARQEVINTLTLRIGNLLPNRLYEFLEVLTKMPSGAELDGLSRADLNLWHQLFERDDHSAWQSRSAGKKDMPDSDAREEVIHDDENPDLQADGMQLQSQNEPDEQLTATASNVEGQDDENDEGVRGDDNTNAGTEETIFSDDKDEKEKSDDEKEDQQNIDTDDIGDTEEKHPKQKSDLTKNTDSSKDEDAWKDISKELEMNLSTFSKEWGSSAGSLLANLQIANRKKYDYADFLRKFMSITEQIILNQDEFDYTYYTFGMNLYGNMPFIEPLEYKESHSIRDFVIAIDTSESVRGEAVRKFIEHSFAILKESQNSSTKVNVHIIQADSKVQSDLKITDLQDIDKFLQGFTLYGFGGTDFRPTFDYIETLRRRGEFSDLKGMIYFTDGYGQFPEKVPDYDTAFVFLDDEEREIPPVPPWAMKVVIDEHDIHESSGIKSSEGDIR